MKRKVYSILCMVMATVLIMSGCGNSSAPAQSAAPAQNAASAESASPSSAAKPASVRKLTIGSGSATSNVFVNASAISTVVNSTMGDQYEISVETSVASAGNVELLEAGEIDIGMISSDMAWEGYNGQFKFEGKQCPSLRTLFPGATGVYMMVTRPDSGIEGISDFAGKAFSGGSNASANATFSNRVFSLFNVNANVSNLPNTDASRGLSDGTLVGFTHSHPSTVVAEYEASNDSKIILLTEEQQKKFLAEYPQYLSFEIPAGYYKGLPEGGKNIGLVNLVVTSTALDEQVVYDIVKCVYENTDTLAASAKAMAASLKKENIGNTTIPYHAGTVRYFKELGWEIPEELIPEEAK